jgi:hypothetical protein
MALSVGMPHCPRPNYEECCEPTSALVTTGCALYRASPVIKWLRWCRRADMQSSPERRLRSTRQDWPAASLCNLSIKPASSQLHLQQTTHLIPREVVAIVAGCRKSLVEKGKRTRTTLSMVFTGESNWRFLRLKVQGRATWRWRAPRAD